MPDALASRNPQWQTKFEQPYANLRLPFRPVLGNHDYYGHQQAQLKYRSDRWRMPARFYHYEVGAGIVRSVCSATQRRSSRTP